MLSHSISSLFFVLSKVLCFACFSLFNLQGTSVRRGRNALRSDVLHFNTTSLTCQALFRFLLTRFRPRPPSKAASRACHCVVFRCLATAKLFYHQRRKKSSIFYQLSLYFDQPCPASSAVFHRQQRKPAAAAAAAGIHKITEPSWQLQPALRMQERR